MLPQMKGRNSSSAAAWDPWSGTAHWSTGEAWSTSQSPKVFGTFRWLWGEDMHDPWCHGCLFSQLTCQNSADFELCGLNILLAIGTFSQTSSSQPWVHSLPIESASASLEALLLSHHSDMICLSLLSLSQLCLAAAVYKWTKCLSLPVPRGAETWVCLWGLLSLVLLMSCWQLKTKHLSGYDVGVILLFHSSWSSPFSFCSNTLRVTRSAAPTSLDASATGGPAQLGKKGKDFDFSQLPMKVEFVECSARGSKGEEGDADFEDLEKWLAKIAWTEKGSVRGRDPRRWGGHIWGVKENRWFEVLGSYQRRNWKLEKHCIVFLCLGAYNVYWCDFFCLCHTTTFSSFLLYFFSCVADPIGFCVSLKSFAFPLSSCQST